MVISEIRSLYRDESPLLSGSVKKIADETLFLELTRRGYNLSSVLRENTGKTAKIIKIG